MYSHGTRNEKKFLAHALSDAFKDDRFVEARRYAQGVESNPDFGRTDQPRSHRAQATDKDHVPLGVDPMKRFVHFSASSSKGAPLRVFGTSRYDRCKQTKQPDP